MSYQSSSASVNFGTIHISACLASIPIVFEHLNHPHSPWVSQGSISPILQMGKQSTGKLNYLPQGTLQVRRQGQEQEPGILAPSPLL